jgi:hypothetical protein
VAQVVTVLGACLLVVTGVGRVARPFGRGQRWKERRMLPCQGLARGGSAGGRTMLWPIWCHLGRHEVGVT